MSGDLQRVELDEGVLDEPVSPRTAETDRRRRRWARGLVAGAAVVVGGLVVAQSVIDARERAAFEELQAVPGVLSPIGDELTVAFEVASPWWLDFPGDRSTLLTVVWSDDGPRLRSTDAATGTLRWDVPLAPDAPRGDGRGAQVHCGSGLAGDRAVVACLDTDGRYEWDEADDLVVLPATYARVVVHAQDDGARLVAWDLEEPVDGIAVHEDQVFVLARDGEDVRLSAHDVATGEENWQRTFLGAAREPSDGDPGNAWLSQGGGAVVVSGLRGDDRVVTYSGQVLPARTVSWGGADGPALFVSRGGASVEVLLDGVLGEEIEREPVPTSVDDGSLGQVVFTTSRGLSAWHAVTGERLWSWGTENSADVGLAAFDGALVLRGDVYAWGMSRVVAFDGEDGRELWSRAASPDDRMIRSVETDGRRLYVLSEDSLSSRSETAVEALTFAGRSEGQIRMPSGVIWTSRLGDQLWTRRDEGSDVLVVLR